MLILTILTLMGLLQLVHSTPFPVATTLTESTTTTYASALLRGEKIFTPSSSEIILPANHTSLERYRNDRAGTNLAGTLCETTSGSPLFQDTTVVVTFLVGLGNQWCCQTQSDGCTSMGYYRTAEVSICGPLNKCIRCGFAAFSADEVNRTCKRTLDQGVKAGGKYGWDSQTNIFVFHYSG